MPVVAFHFQLISAVLITVASLCQATNPFRQLEDEQSPLIQGYIVVAEYPHDKDAFLQGLQFDRHCDDSTKTCTDIFWESTGLHGESSIRRVEVGTGKVLQTEPLAHKWFGEGLARVGDVLYQLVWQTGVIHKWSVKDGHQIEKLGEAQGPLSDGWGLTTDGKQLIATDSGADLYFIDPQTLKITRKVTVKDDDRPVKWLNELEVIEGEVWANIWQTNCIARIDPATGKVKAWLLMNGLREGLTQRYPGHRQMDVLNGIAYDDAGKRIFVTGKKWPRIFEILPTYKLPRQLSLQQVRNMCIM